MSTFDQKPWPKEDEAATAAFLKNVVFQTETDLEMGIPLKSASFVQYLDKDDPQPESGHSGFKPKR